MKLSDIQELIKFVAKSGVSEVELEDKDFKITIKTPPYKRGKGTETETTTVIQQMPVGMPMQQMPMQQMPVQQPASAPAPAAEKASTSNEEKTEDTSKYVEIKSPMIGTFYRKPAPDKPPFVNVGDTIEKGDVVCVIEAMKLFNEIESEVSGKIVKVLVEDNSPVEYDQPLFLVDPS
jgi:acetyl-CoA carboxylase biotin carboxyl carrier protein